MGAVATNLLWDSLKTTVRAYCNVDGTDFDTVLEPLFDAAVADADAYLNNPFEELRPTIVVSSVTAGDTVSIGLGEVKVPSGIQRPERFYYAGSDGSLGIRGGDALTYTAAAAKDEDALEFAIGETDTATADNLCELINSTTHGGSYGAVGVPGVLASNTDGTITLTKRYPNAGDIYVVSSDEDTLMVRQVRTLLSIPKPIYAWVYQYVYRAFKNPGAVIQDSEAGIGTKMWLGMRSEDQGMGINYSMISKWRLEPGM